MSWLTQLPSLDGAMDLPDIQKLFLLAAATVAEEDTDRRMEARAVTDRYDFGQATSDWIFEATRNLGALGFLAPYTRDGRAEDQFVHLTSAGIRKARSFADAGLRVYPRGQERRSVAHSDGSRFSDGTGYAAAGYVEPGYVEDGAAALDFSRSALSVDSSMWTGVKPPAVLAGERLQKVRSAIVDIQAQVEKLDIASNSERQQVMAIVTAIKVLSEAPEPPEKTIKELVALAGNIASVASLFVGLLALFLAK